ncbi:hypothetical protein ACKLNO_05150 [Neisseriaceae bacterium B1]
MKALFFRLISDTNIFRLAESHHLYHFCWYEILMLWCVKVSGCLKNAVAEKG